MVALITPFTWDDQIDYPALKKIIQRLLSEGVDGFIVCGTTAETPTLTQEERFAILTFVVEVTQHAVEIWFGCGRNCTKDTIALCKEAQTYDIDGVLLTAPYYNRPSQEGIYQHFYTIAHAIDTKIMLYNIPSRCAVEIHCDTMLRLLQHCDNIVGLKQASRDVSCVQLLKGYQPNFKIYSGEDGFLDESLDAGMDGLISVMGHCNLALLKQFLKNNRMDNVLRKRLNKEAAFMFLEPSPACVKYVLSKRHECENRLRLPMCPISKATQEVLNNYDGF